MKTIAFLDNKLNHSFDEFEEIQNQLIKILSNKYNFISQRKTKKTSLFLAALFSKIHSLFVSDLLFINGTSCAFLFPLIRLISKKKIIVFSSRVKLSNNTIFYKFYFTLKENIANKFAHAKIVDHLYSKENHVNSALLVRAFPGGNHVEHVESSSNDHRFFRFLKYQYVMSICDVRPENKIEIVLEGFTQTNKMFLVIIGDWNNSSYSKNLKNKYSTFSNIFMMDPISNKRSLDLIRSNAFIYLQTNDSSDRNILLIEAMCSNLPILAFNNINNNLLTEGAAAYFTHSDEINKYITNVNLEKLKNNVLAMGEISKRCYRWKTVCKKYESLIDNLLSAKSN